MTSVFVFLSTSCAAFALISWAGSDLAAWPYFVAGLIAGFGGCIAAVLDATD